MQNVPPFQGLGTGASRTQGVADCALGWYVGALSGLDQRRREQGRLRVRATERHKKAQKRVFSFLFLVFGV